MKILILQQSLKADEFFECISEIIGVHLTVSSIEDFLNTFWKLFGHVLVIYHGISSFKKCLEGLYGHLFQGLYIPLRDYTCEDNATTNYSFGKEQIYV
jgi:hypothetical protein